MESKNESHGMAVVRRCKFCGGKFFSERGSGEYCQASCKQKFYRWRKKLSKSRDKSIQLVKEIASYATYEDTTPAVALALAQISSAISDELSRVNIKIVR